MKKIVFIINVFLCLCMSYAMAQENEAFPTKNAEWKLRCNGCFNNGTNYHVDDYTVSLIDRDTLCLGKIYTIFTERERKGGLRVENSKVWCTFNWEHEFLLYDFDVKEGDTIVHGAVYKDYPYFLEEGLVEESDSIWLNQNEMLSIVERIEKVGEYKLIYLKCYLRELNYHPSYPGDEALWFWGYDTWQEGIGSLNGLFISWATMGPYLTGGFTFWAFRAYTLKMSQNNEVYYYNSDLPEIPEYPKIPISPPKNPDGIDELHMDQYEIQYNEISYTLSINFKALNTGGILCLHDFSGKTILKAPFKEECQIAIPFNLKGYYLCTISQNNMIVFSSKIKL